MNTNTHPAMTMTVPALHALIKDFAGKGFTPSVNINTKTKKVDLQMAVMDLEKKQVEAKDAKKAAPRRGAHADCDHETTKSARAKCRRTRAAEAIAGDQLEAAAKGKGKGKGRKLSVVA